MEPRKHTDLKRLVGQNLRAARLARHLTQSDLAKLVDCRENDVCRWETGAYRPNDERLIALAGSLGVTVADLYREHDDDVAAAA